MTLLPGLIGAHTREKMFEVAESMTTSQGRPVRGGWTDGQYVYGWVLVNQDDPEHPHWAPYIWDQRGKEMPATEHHERIQEILRQ